MPLDETFTNLAAFLNSLDAEGEQKFELSHSLVIICPDCGKNIAFRGRCPKCAGNSWIPAGHAGGIFEKTKAQRLRRMIADDDVTLRGAKAPAVPEEDVRATPQPAVDEATSAAPDTAPAPKPRRRRKRNGNGNGNPTDQT
jgi:hypothetical protein